MKRLLPLLLGFLTACGGDSPRLEVSGDVERCKERLASIHEALSAFGKKAGHAPQSSGVGFLAELITSGILADTPENRALLTCPGKGAEAVPEGTDYNKLTDLNGSHSAYAGRNARSHPLSSYPYGGRDVGPVVACDNAGGMNHDGVMNALFSDGSIRTYVIEELIERGELEAGTTTIEIGPDCAIEDLRVLTKD